MTSRFSPPNASPPRLTSGTTPLAPPVISPYAGELQDFTGWQNWAFTMVFFLQFMCSLGTWVYIWRTSGNWTWSELYDPLAAGDGDIEDFPSEILQHIAAEKLLADPTKKRPAGLSAIAGMRDSTSSEKDAPPAPRPSGTEMVASYFKDEQQLATVPPKLKDAEDFADVIPDPEISEVEPAEAEAVSMYRFYKGNDLASARVSELFHRANHAVDAGGLVLLHDASGNLVQHGGNADAERESEATRHHMKQQTKEELVLGQLFGQS
ncbi:unnamed protein product [Amoebophrya sp. A25]|nr:unnamed protein product [Amoebophrya sp. A25]|eukprot:GSA25T00002468001.1